MNSGAENRMNGNSTTEEGRHCRETEVYIQRLFEWSEGIIKKGWSKFSIKKSSLFWLEIDYVLESVIFEDFLFNDDAEVVDIG